MYLNFLTQSLTNQSFDESQSNASNRYFLAVDGGGTKTRVICADSSGSIVGEGLSGPTNITSTNAGAASFSLREGVRQATEKLPDGWFVSHMVMGLAGMDTPDENQQAHALFSDVLHYYPIKKLTIVNDIVIGMASGSTHPDAITLISGTGSNCYGRNAQGQEAKSSGMDFILADQGSGYQIGLDTLKMAVKSYDGRAAKSSLESAVCAYFQIDSIEHLKKYVYNPTLTKPEIAELAKITFAQHEAGDPVATGILEWASHELLEMARAVIYKLEMQERVVDCVLVGSVTNIPYMHDRLAEQLPTICSQIQLVRPEKEPVFGALKMAMDEAFV